jgi:hypothetical protein
MGLALDAHVRVPTPKCWDTGRLASRYFRTVLVFDGFLF